MAELCSVDLPLQNGALGGDAGLGQGLQKGREGVKFERHPVGVQEGQDLLVKATLPPKDRSVALSQAVFPVVESSLWNGKKG